MRSTPALWRLIQSLIHLHPNVNFYRVVDQHEQCFKITRNHAARGIYTYTLQHIKVMQQFFEMFLKYTLRNGNAARTETEVATPTWW